MRRSTRNDQEMRDSHGLYTDTRVLFSFCGARFPSHPMSDDDRARQARVHNLIAGESLPDPYQLPSLQSQHSKSSSSKSNSPTSKSRTSPSQSQNRPSRKGRTSGNGTQAAAEDVALTFQKQDVVVAPPVSPADRPSSTLAQQLQLARSALDESNFPRSASMAPQRFTVWLPHEEGSMVQIEVPPTCTAHQLVKIALSCAKDEAGGELPSGLLDDPWSYRVLVAEEDGEPDTDYPACDVRMNVCSLGVDAFVLRDRVDAAPAHHTRVSGPNGRPAAGSIIEGPGVDHSQSDATKNPKGFASLETDAEDGEAKKKPEEKQTQCCSNCVIL